MSAPQLSPDTKIDGNLCSHERYLRRRGRNLKDSGSSEDGGMEDIVATLQTFHGVLAAPLP